MVEPDGMKLILRIALWSLATAAVVCGGGCRAQYIRLNSPNSHNALYFDLLRVANYNCYEQWRWGGGLYWVSPGVALVPQWHVNAYGAYGYRDRQFKYGINIARSYRLPHWWRPFVGFSDDLAQITTASVQDAYSLFHSEDNTQIVASQLSRQQVLYAGTSARWNLLKTTAELRYMRQRMLFDCERLLYPNHEDEMPAWSHLVEVHTQLSRRGVTADVRCGTASDAPGWWYLRTLLQYDRTMELEDGNGSVDLFFQTGFATALLKKSDNPLHQLFEQFDISGSYNSYYYFRNCLLTLPAECFKSDCYVRGNVRYQCPVVGWNRRMSAPRPFAQVMTAAGRHHGPHDWSVVGEATVGASGLLLWDRIDLGCALSHQFLNTSTGATCIRPDSYHKRWAFVVSAKVGM